jgi:protein-tyrosine phosphatase
MIDLHTHVAPAIDDGPPDLQGSTALAAAAFDQGSLVLLATPHVSPRYQNRPAAIAGACEALTGALSASGLKIVIEQGAEVDAGLAEELDDSVLAELCLASSSWLLLESPFTPAVETMPAVVAKLRSRGFGVLLAHPERCPGFRRRPEVLRQILGLGAFTSVTATSFTGAFGHEVREFALQLAAEGAVHNVASDAHDADVRRPDLARPLQAARLNEAVELWCEEFPAAILNDAMPPTGREFRALGRRRLSYRARPSRLWPR